MCVCWYASVCVCAYNLIEIWFQSGYHCNVLICQFADALHDYAKTTQQQQQQYKCNNKNIEKDRCAAVNITQLATIRVISKVGIELPRIISLSAVSCWQLSLA